MKQAQPYRKAAARRQTAALRAMQAGRPRYLRNPMDARRAAARKSRRRRPAKSRRRHPLDAVLSARRGR